jgi:hypothetical protein
MRYIKSLKVCSFFEFYFVVFRRLHEDLNNKCQDEKILNSKLYELERKNVVLATENKEVCEEN